MSRGSVAVLLTLLAVAPAGGCFRLGSPSLQERLASKNPRLRVSAAHQLSDSDHPEAEVKLIHLLADRDQGVRFFAAASLRKRTGKRMGYNAELPLRRREEAISKWVDWYCASHPDSRQKFQELLSSFRTLQQPAKDAPEKQGPKDDQDQPAG